MRLLRDPLVAQGVYFVRRTGELEQALTLLLRHRPRPDLVVADLSELSFFGRRPAEVVVQSFLASEIQPRDYIFFTHSGDKCKRMGTVSAGVGFRCREMQRAKSIPGSDGTCCAMVTGTIKSVCR